VRILGNLQTISAAAVLTALSLISPAAVHADSFHASSVADGRTLTHIDNFGRVDAQYYRGAQPEGRDYADLAALGVKTVIDLTGEDHDPGEPRMVEQAGMRYVHIPMTTHQPPTKAQLAEFLSLVNGSANQPVYVHCVGGRHRTGVMTAAYRMTQEGWTADRAFDEMKQYKFGADVLHAEFKTFVYGYHPEVVPAAATSPIRDASETAKAVTE
jgi:uncharacterized protein (TIGR01244 family)